MFNNFKKENYDLIVNGRDKIIVHYGPNYKFLKSVPDKEKIKYFSEIFTGSALASMPGMFRTMMLMGIANIKWKETLVSSFILDTELAVLYNTFENSDMYGTEILTQCETLETFDRDGRTDEEILEYVKSKYPDMNVRWDWFVRGMKRDNGDLVYDGKHMYKVSNCEPQIKGMNVCIEITDSDGNVKQELVNNLWKLNHELPKEDFVLSSEV